VADFEALYAQYFTDVYKYVLSLCRSQSEAEELTQETFFKALQNIDDFKGECRVYVWLCQIAKNTYFSAAKKQKRLVPEEEAPEQAAQSEPEPDFIAGETSFEVQSALHKLEEPYKEVLMLRIFGELPFARIGQLFGKTESWARVTYHRGRSKLKEML
jgi:RNA polymerase sigma-70 factor (ECF subfamily)